MKPKSIPNPNPNVPDVAKPTWAHPNVRDVAKPTWAHPNVRDVAKPTWAHPNVRDVAKPSTDLKGHGKYFGKFGHICQLILFLSQNLQSSRF